ncbi:hypothetical protein WN48_02891 [Eufriesea mexicana]|nr:hypothetical protein WN48_02891 [Eufriesea mexicana]
MAEISDPFKPSTTSEAWKNKKECHSRETAVRARPDRQQEQEEFGGMTKRRSLG